MNNTGIICLLKMCKCKKMDFNVFTMIKEKLLMMESK